MKIIYLGRDFSRKNKVIYRYGKIENNKITEILLYAKKLFKKGTIGALYDCEFKEDSIFYDSSSIPSYFIRTGESRGEATNLFFDLDKYEAEDMSVDAIIKLSKKEFNSIDLSNVNRIYKNLHHSYKSAFLACCIEKITK